MQTYFSVAKTKKLVFRGCKVCLMGKCVIRCFQGHLSSILALTQSKITICIHLQAKTIEGLSNHGMSTKVVLNYRAICGKMCEQIISKALKSTIEKSERVTTQRLTISNSWFSGDAENKTTVSTAHCQTTVTNGET